MAITIESKHVIYGGFYMDNTHHVDTQTAARDPQYGRLLAKCSMPRPWS